MIELLKGLLALIYLALAFLGSAIVTEILIKIIIFVKAMSS